MGRVDFFIDEAILAGCTFDQMHGALTASTIPSNCPPPPPTNAPPPPPDDVSIASHLVSAQTTKRSTRGVATIQVVIQGAQQGSSGVTVTGMWSDECSGSVSRAIDTVGMMTVQKPKICNGRDQCIFCIASLTGGNINNQFGLSHCTSLGGSNVLLPSPEAAPPTSLGITWRTQNNQRVIADLVWQGGESTVDICKEGAILTSIGDANTCQDQLAGNSHKVCNQGSTTKCTNTVSKLGIWLFKQQAARL